MTMMAGYALAFTGIGRPVRGGLSPRREIKNHMAKATDPESCANAPGLDSPTITVAVPKLVPLLVVTGQVRRQSIPPCLNQEL